MFQLKFFTMIWQVISKLQSIDAATNKIVIGTHHKTGTVLLSNIFDQISKTTDLSMIYIGDKPYVEDVENYDIIFDFHSKFAMLDFDKMHGTKGIHIIRDPRILVVSSARYHMTSTERWLHQPDPRFDGMTYQQKLLSLPTDRHRFIFEMNESSRDTITQMLNWVRKNYTWSRNFKLEDLMNDHDFEIYRRMFEHVGLKGDYMNKAIDAAYKYSVFNPGFVSPHMRSSGPESWRDFYDDELASIFVSKFGNAVEELGYDWR